MAEQTPLARQWTLLRLLSARRNGTSVQEFATELNVCNKTIRRDLLLFQSVGMPIEETRSNHGRKLWRIALKGDPPGISFNLDEALALYLGRRFLDPLSGTVIGQAAERAFEKIRACLRPSAIKYLELLSASLHHTGPNGDKYAAHSHIIGELLNAVENRRTTCIEYHSQRASQPAVYEVDPYAVAFHRASLYLVAFSKRHGEMRHFKVDRIQTAEVTRFSFEPVEFDVKRHFDGSAGIFHGKENHRVRIWFHPSVAQYVQETRWHHSQVLTPADPISAAPSTNGSHETSNSQGHQTSDLAELTTIADPTSNGVAADPTSAGLIAEYQLNSLEEVASWILSFGPLAKALEPEALRTQIATSLASALARYDTDTNSTMPNTSTPEKSQRLHTCK